MHSTVRTYAHAYMAAGRHAVPVYEKNIDNVTNYKDVFGPVFWGILPSQQHRTLIIIRSNYKVKQEQLITSKLKVKTGYSMHLIKQPCNTELSGREVKNSKEAA